MSSLRKETSFQKVLTPYKGLAPGFQRSGGNVFRIVFASNLVGIQERMRFDERLEIPCGERCLTCTVRPSNDDQIRRRRSSWLITKMLNDLALSIWVNGVNGLGISFEERQALLVRSLDRCGSTVLDALDRFTKRLNLQSACMRSFLANLHMSPSPQSDGLPR